MTTFQPAAGLQPYGATVPGAVTSDYGVTNPKPAGQTGLFGSMVWGEMMGNGQADEHMGDAQYTPITHVLRDLLGCSGDGNPMKMLHVGQLVVVWRDKQSRLCASVDHMPPPEKGDFSPGRVVGVYVLAAAVDVPAAPKLFAMTAAVQDTQTVLLPSYNPKLLCTPPNSLYVHLNRCNCHPNAQSWEVIVSTDRRATNCWPLGRALLPVDRFCSEVSVSI